MASMGGFWRAVDDRGVVVTMKPDRDEAVGIVSSAGTDELPVAVEVRAEDGTVDEVLVFPAATDARP